MSDYFHWHMNMFKYAMNYITVEKNKYYQKWLVTTIMQINTRLNFFFPLETSLHPQNNTAASSGGWVNNLKLFLEITATVLVHRVPDFQRGLPLSQSTIWKPASVEARDGISGHYMNILHIHEE